MVFAGSRCRDAWRGVYAIRPPGQDAANCHGVEIGSSWQQLGIRSRAAYYFHVARRDGRSHHYLHHSKPRLVSVVMYVLFLRIGSWASARSIAMLYDCPRIIIVLPCAARPLDPIPIASNGCGEECRRCVGNHDHTPGPLPWVTGLRVRSADSRCAGRSRSS